MKEARYCPNCKKEVELIAACGATNYFCNHCKRLVSSKAVLTKEQVEKETHEETSDEQ